MSVSPTCLAAADTGISLINNSAIAPALLQLRAFFAENSRYEQPALGMSAEWMAQMASELQVARTEALQAERRRVEAKQARDAARRTLYKRVVGLRRELLQLLGADDPRWRDFGYRRPVDGKQPEPVTDLTVRSGGEQEIVVSWSPSPRAKSYRITVQDKDAPDQAPAEILSVGTEVVVPIATLGQRMVVNVTAINKAGETRAVQVEALRDNMELEWTESLRNQSPDFEKVINVSGAG